MLDDFQDDEDLNKGSEFLDEFRQRLNSRPLENLEERKNDINRSQHIFLGTILGVGLAGIVSWFILSPDYSKTEDAEIPVIRRPSAAIKVQPSEPGGMEILNQDKTVYDIVEKKDTADIKVENLLPPPEEPKLPVAAPAENETTAEIKIVDSAVVKDAEKIIASEEQKQVQKPAADEEIKIVIKKETPPAEENKKTVEPQKEVQTPKETPAPVIAQAGEWQIQLISSPNKTAMEKAWADLSKKYSALKGLPHEVEAADLGSKGIFYRLKAGAFKERADADKVCNAVKSAGGSCLVKKK